MTLDPKTTHSAKVSVVVPTHNRAELLRRAVASVLNQTYHDLEVIIIDDASRDATRDAVETMRDQRISYIRHGMSKGGSAARNTGIHVAKGKYIAFLDDDDEWEPTKVQEQLDALGDYDAVMCTSNEPGSVSRRFSTKATVELEDLRRGHFTAGGTGILLARAEVMKDTLFDETLPRCQDWDVFIRIAHKYQIAYLNKALLRYNEGEHGRISNAILNMPVAEMERKLAVLDKHRDFFGNRWFRIHMSDFLLYGIKHRKDKLKHITYTVQKYGIWPVLRALCKRSYQKLTEIS